MKIKFLKKKIKIKINKAECLAIDDSIFMTGMEIAILIPYRNVDTISIFSDVCFRAFEISCTSH